MEHPIESDRMHLFLLEEITQKVQRFSLGFIQEISQKKPGSQCYDAHIENA